MKNQTTIDYNESIRKLKELNNKAEDLELQLERCKDEKSFSVISSELNSLNMRIEAEENRFNDVWSKSDKQTYSIKKNTGNKPRMRM